jgi:hypothetical protein
MPSPSSSWRPDRPTRQDVAPRSRLRVTSGSRYVQRTLREPRAVRSSRRSEPDDTVSPALLVVRSQQSCASRSDRDSPPVSATANKARRFELQGRAIAVQFAPPIEAEPRFSPSAIFDHDLLLIADQLAPSDRSTDLLRRLFARACGPPRSSNRRKSDLCTATRLIDPSASTSTARHPEPV